MLIDKIKKTIQKYNLINEEDKLLIGVSGGPDSIALLNVLHELGYNICVAHINHGIRENAINDQKYVEDFCKERNIPCFVKEVKLRRASSTPKLTMGQPLSMVTPSAMERSMPT